MAESSSLYDWVTNHPLAVTVLLFVLGCVVSLYAGEIRRALSIPPQTVRVWSLKIQLASLEYRIGNLTRCHESSYRTLLHFLPLSITPFLFVFMTSLMTWVDTQLPQPHPGSHPILDRVFLAGWIFMSGVILARLFALQKFFWKLRDYEDSLAKLKEAHAKVCKKLLLYTRKGEDVDLFH